jgi:GR25 family glycosyltransferase involved in LPS biosynthesis
MLDKIYIINLDKRTDRWEHVEKNVIPFLPYPEKIQRFSAVDHTHYNTSSRRAAGCTYSHLKIWQESIDLGYSSILVIEDDLVWIRPKEFIAELLETLCEVKANLCNLAYFNKSGLGHTSHPHLFRCTNVQTTGCYFANVNFLSEIYNHIENSALELMKDKPRKQFAIDIAWKKFQDNPKWFIATKCARQIADFSDIENTHVNYNFC